MYLILFETLNSDKKHFCFAIKMYRVDSGVFNLFPVGGEKTLYFLIQSQIHGALARPAFKVIFNSTFAVLFLYIASFYITLT